MKLFKVMAATTLALLLVSGPLFAEVTLQQLKDAAAASALDADKAASTADSNARLAKKTKDDVEAIAAVLATKTELACVIAEDREADLAKAKVGTAEYANLSTVATEARDYCSLLSRAVDEADKCAEDAIDAFLLAVKSYVAASTAAADAKEAESKAKGTTSLEAARVAAEAAAKALAAAELALVDSKLAATDALACGTCGTAANDMAAAAATKHANAAAVVAAGLSASETAAEVSTRVIETEEPSTEEMVLLAAAMRIANERVKEREKSKNQVDQEDSPAR